MKFNNDFYEEDTNSGPNMTVIYMVLIMSTVILGVLAIVLWANKGMNHNNGSGYAKALAQKQEREQQTMITEGEVPAAASAGDTLTSGNLTSDQLDIWTLPDTGREKQTASSGRNNGTVTNQTTGEVVIGGSDSKDENTKTATADELAKGKTSVYDMTEKENLKEDEKASKDSKKDDDKETKDAEIVRYDEDIEVYMAREVFPHIPDAKAFFEENLTAKKPVVKIGAEIPFTRYFYKYVEPQSSEVLANEFQALEETVRAKINNLF